MAKFSVAIFGHEKPEYYIRRVGTFEQVVQEPAIVKGKPQLISRIAVQTDPAVALVLADEFVEYDDEIRSGDFRFPKPDYYLYEVTGRIKRAIPGDVIAWKPFEDAHRWTDTERKEFLIMTIDGPDNIEAMMEPEWDLGSYQKYEPMEFKAWLELMADKNKTKADPVKADSLLIINKDKWYAEYLQGCYETACMPTTHWRKRRFNISLDRLETLGVQTDIMLNKAIEYQPKIATVDQTYFYDKLKQRDVLTTDGLNRIRPLTLSECRSLKPLKPNWRR